MDRLATVVSVDFSFFVYDHPGLVVRPSRDRPISGEEWLFRKLLLQVCGYELERNCGVVRSYDGLPQASPDIFWGVLDRIGVKTEFKERTLTFVADLPSCCPYALAFNSCRPGAPEYVRLLHFSGPFASGLSSPMDQKTGASDSNWMAHMIRTQVKIAEAIILMPAWSRTFLTLNSASPQEAEIATWPRDHAPVQFYWVDEWCGLREPLVVDAVFCARNSAYVPPWADGRYIDLMVGTGATASQVQVVSKTGVNPQSDPLHPRSWGEGCKLSPGAVVALEEAVARGNILQALPEGVPAAIELEPR